MFTIGIDIGTTSICCVVYDENKKVAVNTISKPHNATIKTQNEFEHIQDADVLINVALQSIEESFCKFKNNIKAICVTGQMHGGVYIDKEGKVLSPLYTWMDARGRLPYNKDESYVSHYSKLLGARLNSGYGLITHLYNAKNNIVPQKAAYMCTIMDLLTMRLYKSNIPITDASNAESFGLKCCKNNLYKQIFNDLKIDLSVFPLISNTGEIVGVMKNKVKVINAIGDNQACAYSSIGLNESELLINIGTSGQVSAITDGARNGDLDVKLDLRPYMDNKNLLTGAFLNGGNTYTLLKDFFEGVINAFKDDIKVNAYAVMNKLLEESLEVNNNIIVDTKFFGTRSDPNVTGKIHNITANNFKVGNLINAFANGIINEAFELYNAMPIEVKSKHKNIVIAGNLLKHANGFTAIINKKFKLPVKVTQCEEDAAVGAAIIAAKARL